MNEHSEMNVKVDRFVMPKWTVLYNIVSDNPEWVGTGWEFFTDKKDAEKCFDKQRKNGNCATLRPFHKGCDTTHLGVAHRAWL